jgi:hypothetical protein
MGCSETATSEHQNQHIYATTRSYAVGFQYEVVSFNSGEKI